jgi:DNA repair protein RadA/Sms
MSKNPKIIYICQNCGYQTPKWLGKCPDCNQWDSMVEEPFHDSLKTSLSQLAMSMPQEISSIEFNPDSKIKPGLDEFDRAIGGGIVPGSLLLLGGEPGIGKSTLILQVAGKISLQNLNTVYLSGEESAQQIKLRAQRLSINSKNIFIVTGTRIEELFERVREIKTDLLVVDSIQTTYTDTLPSAPGSVGQIREVSSQILRWAKEKGIPTILIGHITKEGSIAGPKILEHLVDTSALL